MDEALLQRLLQTLGLELEENARTFETDLLTLEREPPEGEREELLMSLVQSAHSLKGAARSAGLGWLASVCYNMQSVFHAVHEGRRTLEPGDFEVLFAAREALAKVAVRLRDGQNAEYLVTPELSRALEDLQEGSGFRRNG